MDWGVMLRWVLLILGPVVLSVPPPAAAQSEELWQLMEIQARHEEEILAIPGVVGMGIGKAEATGQLEYKIFAAALTPAVRAAVPTAIEGVHTAIEETGAFAAR